MKPILTKIFVALGVIFLLFIIAGIYFYVADPYKLKPLIFGTMQIPSANTVQNADSKSPATASPAAKSTSKGFPLTAAQKQAIISLGVDASLVPSSVSPQQEDCFISVLGEARVAQVRAGAVPSAMEFLKAKACI